MTVIFHTNAGTPVLAGDMLLSMPGPNIPTDLRLPSQPNGIIVPTNLSPRNIPVLMRRKIFVVNDHLAAGAAGSALHIGPFIIDLFAEFHGRRDFSYSEITTFLDQYAASSHGGEVLEQISLLLVAEATDWRGSITKGINNHRNLKTQSFGRVVTVGSGSDSIVKQVRSLDTKYKFGWSEPTASGDQFPEFIALARNLLLLADVYWNEFVSPANIFEAWGGAYDLIYQDTRKVFQHLKDYTIFFRMYDADNADLGIQLVNVLKYERRPEVSFIIMPVKGKLEFFGAKDITASEEPISVKYGKDDLTMNSQIHISIIAVGKGNRYLRPLIQIDGLDPEGQGRQTVFTQFDDEGRLCILFHSEHDEWLQEQVFSLYEQHAPF